jgi:hypothetical protein
VEDGLRRHHLRAAGGTLYLEPLQAKSPVELTLLRHIGTSPASIRAYDLTGKLLLKEELPATGETIDAVKIVLRSGGPYRIELKSADTRAWDLITTQPVRRVFHTPTWKELEALTPRVYFRLKPGAKEVRLTLEADGEGFKGAVLYSPQGNPAAVTEQFVEYGDTKHHQYELKAAAPGAQLGGLWSLDLQQVSVSRAEGIQPYVSTHPAAFFIPAAAGR